MMKGRANMELKLGIKLAFVSVLTMASTSVLVQDSFAQSAPIDGTRCVFFVVGSPIGQKFLAGQASLDDCCNSIGGDLFTGSAICINSNLVGPGETVAIRKYSMTPVCEVEETVNGETFVTYKEAVDGTCPLDDEPDKDDGCAGENGAGNPCNVATGNKFQTETDFSYGDISFTRAYNSRNLTDIGLGHGWRMNYQPKLTVSDNAITLISKSGRGEPWSKVGGVWRGDADSELILEQINEQFIVTYPNERTETYDANGRLLVQASSNGFNTTYEYNTENQLSEVTNDYGRKISFSYVDGRLSTIIDPAGEVYRYTYGDFRNLVSVVFPDATANDDTDNPRKIYHYENNNFPNHLTGITDENGNRYATFAYDALGKAISTEHSQTTNTVGQERFGLNFQGAN